MTIQTTCVVASLIVGWLFVAHAAASSNQMCLGGCKNCSCAGDCDSICDVDNPAQARAMSSCAARYTTMGAPITEYASNGMCAVCCGTGASAMMQVAKSAMPAGTGEVAAQILPMPRIVPHQFPRLPPIKGEAMYGTSVYRNGPEGKRIYMIFGEFNSEEIAVIERMTQIYKADLTEQAKKLMTELI